MVENLILQTYESRSEKSDWPGTAAWISSMRTTRCLFLVSADVVTPSSPQTKHQEAKTRKHGHGTLVMIVMARTNLKRDSPPDIASLFEVGDIPGVRFKVVKARYYL